MPRRPRTLKPVRPSAAIKAQYQRELDTLISEMQRSIFYWLRANYRKVEPEIAADANPVKLLQRLMNRMTKQWRERFYERADEIATRFISKTEKHTTRSFQKALKDAGMTIEFKPTQPVKDAMEAAVNENVLLIKSIADHHLSEVNQMVMRAVSNGSDWTGVAEQLEDRFGITKRRAHNIVRDQESKATASINRARQIETGLFEAIWVHSAGGKTQRASHVKAGRDKLKFDVREGALIDGERIWPGTEINCFPGDTLVSLDHGCQKIWRRHYEGHILSTEIEGVKIRTTPNHPFLTNKGWVAAQFINRGDDIWKARRKDIDPGVSNPYVGQTTFENAFETLRSLGKGIRGCVGVFNFHSDIPDTEVETVGVEPALSFKGNFSSRESIRQLLFPHTDSGTFVEIDFSPKVGHSSEPGSSGDALKFFGTTVSEADDVCFAASSYGKTQCIQSSSNEKPTLTHLASDLVDRNLVAVEMSDGGIDVVSLPRSVAVLIAPNDFRNCSLGDTQHTSDGDRGVSFSIKPKDLFGVDMDIVDARSVIEHLCVNPCFSEVLAEFICRYGKVIGKSFECGEFVYERNSLRDEFRREFFKGHVYTLQSDNGMYSIGHASTATKNCRCVSKIVLPF